MNHKRPPIPVIVIVVLVIAVSAYFLVSQSLGKKDGALTASGFIEATQVNLAPELAGKVIEVLAAEGQPVRAGDPLLRLDPSLLAAQRAVAAAALQTANSAAQTAQDSYEVAQAQYTLTATAAWVENTKARTMDWMTNLNYFEQPQWYFTQEEQIAAAHAGIQQAADELNLTKANLDQVVADLDNTEFLGVETRLANAQVAYLAALNTYSRAQASGGGVSPDELPVRLPSFLPNGYRTRIRIANQMPDNQELVDAAKDAYDIANAELASAEQAYKEILDTDAAENVLKARAELSVALERFQAAQDQLTLLQTGEHSLKVTAASAVLDQAKSAVQQALDAAKQAEANLALIDAQIEKLTIYAPSDGIVLTRNVEVGEFVQPGATAFVLGELGSLTITVYVPEDRFGGIQLGQSAVVSVDSFPGLTFDATVIKIADKAEFTPRNVQTVEGRSSTVYAIKLSVDNPEGKLKIGMPADVVFSDQ